MISNITTAPGKDLNSFLKELSYDLKRKKIEYLNIGLFNKQIEPIGMMEIKGKSSWVGFDVNQIVELARKHKAYGICFLHNHPCGPKESPNLSPSQDDFTALRKILDVIKGDDLQFYGSWITSNNQLTEILNYYSNNWIKQGIESLFSDVDISTYLTLQLRESFDALTKSNLLQTSWFSLFTKYIGRCKFVFNILRIKYYGESETFYTFRLDVEDELESAYVGTLSTEEAFRAVNALKELIIAIDTLRIEDDEYAELKIELSENVKCVAYKDNITQNASITVNGHHVFVKISDLEVLLDFFERGFAKIDFLISLEDEI